MQADSLTKTVPILYLFFKLFSPIFCAFFSNFPDYFKVILNYFKPIILKQKNSRKIVWLASHKYCKDSFKIEKMCMRFDDKIGSK